MLIVTVTALLFVPSSSAYYVGQEPANNYNGPPHPAFQGKQDANINVMVNDDDTNNWVYNIVPLTGVPQVRIGQLPPGCAYVWFVKYDLSLQVPVGYDRISVIMNIELLYKPVNQGWQNIETEWCWKDWTQPFIGNINGYIYVGDNSGTQPQINDEYKVHITYTVGLYIADNVIESESATQDLDYLISAFIRWP